MLRRAVSKQTRIYSGGGGDAAITMATRFDVTRYMESEGREKVISAKEEQTFNDMGVEVRVWNVVTEQGRWWVVEGDGVPMNLYSQDAYYFSSDEVYSFHMGVLARVQVRHEKDPEHALRDVRFGEERFHGVRRKLHVAAQALSTATEPEDKRSSSVNDARSAASNSVSLGQPKSLSIH